jgi:DNA polymerase I
MELAQNQTLFGQDPESGIVAVEFSPPDRVVVYGRAEDGRTTVTETSFQPYLWTSLPGESSVPLNGSLALSHLARFDSWQALQKARTSLKAAKIAHFALNDPAQQYLSITGKTLFKNLPPEALRRLQIDIETACTEGFEFSIPERDSITAIAVSDQSGWEEFIAVDPGAPESERAALERLTAIIEERDPDLVEGHNLFKFDLPYLSTRAKRLDVPLRWGRDRSLLSSRAARLQIAEKAIQYTRFAIHGRHIIDTYILAQHYDVGTRELENFGLKHVARHFGVSEPDRVLLEGCAIDRARVEQPETFRNYALHDVRETRALARVLTASYLVQARIFPYNLQDVILRGNATKIDALFLREYLRQSYSIPDFPEPEPFEGGYTDVFRTGIIRDVWHCDVASLYPSVMLRFGLLPGSDALEVFGSMLSNLRAFRLEAKARMAAASGPERRRLDGGGALSSLRALQNTFKILINSFYGYLGFSQGHFADFKTAAAVTAKGRELLRIMVDWLSLQGAEVIEIDTDGIYFKPPPSATPGSLDAGMKSVLPDGIDVEFDRQFPAMFSYKAKNYALLDSDGNLVLKGAALKSRGLEKFQRDFLEQMLRLLLTGDPGAVHTLRDEFERKIRRREWPIEMLAKTETLQDSLASYRKKIDGSSRNRSAAFELALKSGRDYQAGDQITYYVAGADKRVTAYEAARPVREWNPARRDENVEYYVAKLDELFRKFAPFLPSRTEQIDFKLD